MWGGSSTGNKPRNWIKTWYRSQPLSIGIICSEMVLQLTRGTQIIKTKLTMYMFCIKFTEAVLIRQLQKSSIVLPAWAPLSRYYVCTLDILKLSLISLLPLPPLHIRSTLRKMQIISTAICFSAWLGCLWRNYVEWGKEGEWEEDIKRATTPLSDCVYWPLQK